MKKTIVFPLYCLFMIVVVSSCKQTTSDAKDFVVAATQPTHPMQVQTLQSLQTPVSVFEYTDQVSDGKLVFSVQDVENVCHDIKKPIKLKLIFSNITDKTINVLNEFSIAVNRRGDGGNIIPFITSSEGEDVYTLADFQLVDIFNTPSIKYLAIQPNRTVDIVVDFRFPNLASQTLPDETIKIMTPSPGQYNIRFVYIEHQRDSDTWYGAIGSNQIRICAN